MAKQTKRRKAIAELFSTLTDYSIDEALGILKQAHENRIKFDETVEISVKLGVDPRKSDQMVRGAVVLPHGTGRSVRVAVFTQGANVQAAKDAGADIVGLNDLADSIKAGNIDFDVVVASPDAMGVVGQLGQILGPKGLMPNPKTGTVTMDVARAVSNAKSGQVQFRVDKAGLVHCPVGKLSFEPKALALNIQAVIADLKRLKPSTSKGQYLQKLSISSTMGPGLRVVVDSLQSYLASEV